MERRVKGGQQEEIRLVGFGHVSITEKERLD